MNRKWIIAAGLAATMALVSAAPPSFTPLENKVRHELVMLPYLNVFDDISFRVDGNTVTLFGEVTNPVLRSDAENVVKRVESRGSKIRLKCCLCRASTMESGCEQRVRSSDTRPCSGMEWARSRRSTSS
jgi:hypothetical protein